MIKNVQLETNNNVGQYHLLLIKILTFQTHSCVHFIVLEMEKKLLEERSLKQKVENLLLEAEKRCSLLDCDLKQSQQKLSELLEQKDVLSEDVSVNYTK